MQGGPDLSGLERRYRNLRIALLLSLSLFAFIVPVIAGSMVTVTQNGHLRITNGTNAGLSVSPNFLEFGNVTWGQSITKQITVQNTGDCVENVTATAIQPNQTPVIAFIPSLSPAHSQIVNATYDTRQFGSPGDYTFSITWTAKCL